VYTGFWYIQEEEWRYQSGNQNP